MAAKDNKRRGTEKLPRLFIFSLGLLYRKRVRKILTAHGWNVSVGLPRKGVDLVGVWGRKKTAKRGQRIAQMRNADLITIEDGFLRSVRTGRQGEPGLSMILDRKGIYFDTNEANDLNDLIMSSRNATKEELDDASENIELLCHLKLSKYNATFDQAKGLPDEYVLVIDQTYGDGSITLGGANADTFSEMLLAARTDNPDLPIVIKTHPETNAGKRAGHYSDTDLQENDLLFDAPVSPWVLFKKAKSVYCVTSQMGMESIFAGHKPVVFGKPFYAGWGLTNDRHPKATFNSLRTVEHLFWAVYHKYTLWYDPGSDKPSSFIKTARNLSAQKRAWVFAQRPKVMIGMRLWKRGFIHRYFAKFGSVRLLSVSKRSVAIASEKNGDLVIWANALTPDISNEAEMRDVTIWRMEDGFIRSAGLGANLVRPCSLALDDLGIYYDPRSPSRLEKLLETSDRLKPIDLKRAKSVRQNYIALNLSKYNLEGAELTLSPQDGQQVILVPGQVEDDASILSGTNQVRTNTDLIRAARQMYPDDYIIYKPHPDVEAGLRIGAVDRDVLNGVVDLVARNADIGSLIEQSDCIATMTSLTGFEALLRGKTVICFGMPFYAGWGLTIDKAQAPERRTAKLSLDQMVHSTLIDYPCYWDPLTQDPCSIETILDRFKLGQTGIQGSSSTKLLSKLQGVFASYAHWWR